MVPTVHRGEAKVGEFGPDDGAAPCHQCRDDFRGAFLGGLFLPWTTGGAQVVELLCLTCRTRRDWLHPSPCRTQPLPAELLGSGLLPYVRSNFQSNAAFFRSNSGRNGKAGQL